MQFLKPKLTKLIVIFIIIASIFWFYNKVDKAKNPTLLDIAFINLQNCENQLDALTYQSQVQSLLLQTKNSEINELMAKADVLENKKDLVNAIIIYDKIILIDKKYSPAYLYKAQIYFQTEDFANAMKNLQSAAKIEPRNYLVWYGIGETYSKIGDYKSAAYAYEKALYFNPFMEEAKRGLRSSYAKSKGIAM